MFYLTILIYERLIAIHTIEFYRLKVIFKIVVTSKTFDFLCVSFGLKPGTSKPNFSSLYYFYHQCLKLFIKYFDFSIFIGIVK